MATIGTLGYALLCVLSHGPCTGYQLVQRLRHPIGYYWTARQSQIYPELARLTELGWIDHDAEPRHGPRPRKTHRITTEGRAALAHWLAQPPAPAVPRSELVLKTYALGAADPAAMREMYLGSATEHEARLAEYRTQHARAVQDGADDPRHPRFGAYATLTLGIATETEIVRWCRWLADVSGGRPAAPTSRRV